MQVDGYTFAYSHKQVYAPLSICNTFDARDVIKRKLRNTTSTLYDNLFIRRLLAISEIST